jgi:hypothetical protein
MKKPGKLLETEKEKIFSTFRVIVFVCLFDEESSMALQDLLKNIGERSCVDQRSRQLSVVFCCFSLGPLVQRSYRPP